MDALFKRYASPYDLLDTVIASRGLAAFIGEMWERETEDNLFEIWLHKCWNSTSFEEFKRRAIASAQPKPSERTIEATIKSTLAMLDGFDPEGVKS